MKAQLREAGFETRKGRGIGDKKVQKLLQF